MEAFTSAHQPRALAWDGARDALYVGGLGNDEIVQVVRASQVDPAQGAALSVPASGDLTKRCGVDGLAAAPDGALYVWCSFTRSVARLDTLDGKGALRAAVPRAAVGPELVASTMAPARHDGMVLFHTANESISQFAGLACASCHLDGRSDGLSWRIHGQDLQTPMLCGRMVGTAPFKWDGTAPDLASSVRATVTRLGGDGLSKPHVAALVAYLEGMPAVRTPPPRDPAAVARGQALFDSDLGCTACHDGAAYTDRARHDFRGAKRVDTPSLVGLAASAPYFHDGSAATLEAVLRERGAVHGMADAARALSDAEVGDLVAYLQTL
jgi:mono/diheme cytochrome c family protein